MAQVKCGTYKMVACHFEPDAPLRNFRSKGFSKPVPPRQSNSPFSKQTSSKLSAHIQRSTRRSVVFNFELDASSQIYQYQGLLEPISRRQSFSRISRQTTIQLSAHSKQSVKDNRSISMAGLPDLRFLGKAIYPEYIMIWTHAGVYQFSKATADGKPIVTRYQVLRVRFNSSNTASPISFTVAVQLPRPGEPENSISSVYQQIQPVVSPKPWAYFRSTWPTCERHARHNLPDVFFVSEHGGLSLVGSCICCRLDEESKRSCYPSDNLELWLPADSASYTGPLAEEELLRQWQWVAQPNRACIERLWEWIAARKGGRRSAIHTHAEFHLRGDPISVEELAGFQTIWQ